MAGVILLDASALIALYNDHDAHHAWSIDFLNQTLEDALAITTLTLAETLVRPIETNNGERFQNSIAGLNIQVLGMENTDPYGLADLRVETKLRLPDADVLYTAIKTRSALATADKKIAAEALKRKVKVYQPAA